MDLMFLLDPVGCIMCTFWMYDDSLLLSCDLGMSLISLISSRSCHLRIQCDNAGIRMDKFSRDVAWAFPLLAWPERAADGADDSGLRPL
jgi:hypothetical protein